MLKPIHLDTLERIRFMEAARRVAFEINDAFADLLPLFPTTPGRVRAFMTTIAENAHASGYQDFSSLRFGLLSNFLLGPQWWLDPAYRPLLADFLKPLGSVDDRRNWLILRAAEERQRLGVRLPTLHRLNIGAVTRPSATMTSEDIDASLQTLIGIRQFPVADVTEVRVVIENDFRKRCGLPEMRYRKPPKPSGVEEWAMRHTSDAATPATARISHDLEPDQYKSLNVHLHLVFSFGLNYMDNEAFDGLGETFVRADKTGGRALFDLNRLETFLTDHIAALSRLTARPAA